MPPEEVHGSVQGPNGERLQIQIGQKAVGLVVKDLLPILLLLSGLVGGYLIWVAMQQRLDLVQSVLVRILEHQVRHDQQGQKDLTQLREWLQTHEYNTGREPGDRLPLTIDPAHLPSPKPAP